MLDTGSPRFFSLLYLTLFFTTAQKLFYLDSTLCPFILYICSSCIFGYSKGLAVEVLLHLILLNLQYCMLPNISTRISHYRE
ncbi:uncharacterized protein RHIMIDRAFT_86844 [Rhizopus microsporus ATCC 52813]|uniref:Uncharacterized protein n=1 Tax=Rhizopus microsporus ATCC 52813 TaxID=1340429 RepID=A0A2G4T2N7_RHIZD|nr:uncharacterized protein RHIMIDRAFT_86844 [Rhizopus microsporus ATCC 52813]PHZ15282.1 hypothetical protein RHIMIDRAFT_86844 [Rhizopus microsporus ATCC 52813]